MELLDTFYNFLLHIIDIFLHLDTHLDSLVVSFGPWLYLLVFLVIFGETGLVIAPILPGDSLLFALGALAAREGSPLNVWILCGLLWIASILGDATNYAIGSYLGPKVFTKEDSWIFNKNHIKRTRAFYEKYGGKTIILARFMPIVRTFAPFVAGVGKMHYGKFAIYNVAGGLLWVAAFLFGGYMLGNVESVKHNFHIVIVAIVLISATPAAIEFLRARKRGGAH